MEAAGTELEQSGEIIIEGGSWHPSLSELGFGPAIHEDWIQPSKRDKLIRDLSERGKGFYVLPAEEVPGEDETIKITRHTRYLMSDKGEVYKEVQYQSEKGGFRQGLGAGLIGERSKYRTTLELVGKGKLELVFQDKQELPETDPAKYKLVIEPPRTGTNS